MKKRSCGEREREREIEKSLGEIADGLRDGLVSDLSASSILYQSPWPWNCTSRAVTQPCTRSGMKLPAPGSNSSKKLSLWLCSVVGGIWKDKWVCGKKTSSWKFSNFSRTERVALVSNERRGKELPRIAITRGNKLAGSANKLGLFQSANVSDWEKCCYFDRSSRGIPRDSFCFLFLSFFMACTNFF